MRAAKSGGISQYSASDSMPISIDVGQFDHSKGSFVPLRKIRSSESVNLVLVVSLEQDLTASLQFSAPEFASFSIL